MVSTKPRANCSLEKLHPVQCNLYYSYSIQSWESQKGQEELRSIMTQLGNKWLPNQGRLLGGVRLAVTPSLGHAEQEDKIKQHLFDERAHIPPLQRNISSWWLLQKQCFRNSFFLISQTYLSLTYGFMSSLNLSPVQDIEELVKKKSLSVTKKLWELPGGPVVGNPPSNAGDVGLIPGWGTKIPHALGQLSPQATVKSPRTTTRTQHSQG